MNEKELGKRLQVARQKAGLTQQELCAKASLSISTLAKIERGAIKAPSIFTVSAIASAVQVPLQDLIGRPGILPSKSVPKKQSKTGVRFVFFDVNGVMIRFFHRAFAKIAEATNVPADIIETAFWHYNDAACSGELSVAEFDRLFADKVGVKHIDWESYYFENIESITDMHDVAKWASEHYRIGLLTNIMPGFLDRLIKEGFVPNLDYEVIGDSSVVGAVKPQSRIFEYGQAAVNLPPNEILLVDDSRGVVTAAGHAGWRVLWFDDYSPIEGAERVRVALEF